MGRRGWAGGNGGGCASPKELRLAWHQDQGDPAYLGVVPRTLAQSWLIRAQAR